MVTIQIAGDMLGLEMQGFDKLWSLRSTLRIPIAHVKGAADAAGVERDSFHGLRVGGTFNPCLLTAGTFYQKEGFVFGDVHNSEKAIRIGLDHEHFRS